jgi:hypothetical protein
MHSTVELHIKVARFGNELKYYPQTKGVGLNQLKQEVN